jgi:succinate dehydrogenase/fumarate reductase iron-sulfur protein
VKVKCEIFRFEPFSGVEKRYDTYLLDADPTDTVLGLLLRINREFDSTLSFRFACGVIKCGECGVVVNGTPCLACEKMVDAEMKIEPLPNLPIIKDLVVNRKDVFEGILRNFPLLSECKQGHPAYDPSIYDSFVRLTKCFECLICQSTCPVCEEVGSFIGPLGLLWMAQMAVCRPNRISRDEIAKRLSGCLRCGSCSEACPCSDDILSQALDILEKQ